jgi:hypothetical protein
MKTIHHPRTKPAERPRFHQPYLNRTEYVINETDETGHIVTHTFDDLDDMRKFYFDWVLSPDDTMLTIIGRQTTIGRRNPNYRDNASNTIHYDVGPQ